MKKAGFLLLLGILTILPIISAFDYSSPFSFFENEWTLFVVVLLLLFASIYAFLSKRIDNHGVAGIISLALSILITIPITKRAILMPFLDESIIDTIMVIALVIFFLFLFYRFGTKKTIEGNRKIAWGKILLIFILIALLSPFLKQALPESITEGPAGDFIEAMASIGIWGFIIAIVIIILWWYIRRKLRRREYRAKGYYERAGELSAQGRRGWR